MNSETANSRAGYVKLLSSFTCSIISSVNPRKLLPINLSIKKKRKIQEIARNTEDKLFKIKDLTIITQIIYVIKDSWRVDFNVTKRLSSL